MRATWIRVAAGFAGRSMRWTLPTLLATLLGAQLSSAQQTPDPPQGSFAAAPAGGRERNRTEVRRTVVLVQDVDAAGRRPFQHSFGLEFGDPPGAGSVFAVPRRTLLIIDAVAVDARGAASVGMSCSITTSAGRGSATLFIALPAAVETSGTGTLYRANQAVRAYADAGSDVATVCSQEAGAPGAASAQVTVIGHLVGR
jgi:hypothetical protein